MSGSATDTTAGVSLGGGTGTSDGGSGGNTQSQTTSDGGAPATGSQGQQPAGDVWYNSFSDQGLKQLAERKGWKGAEDALKSYKELETAFSQKADAPKAPAAPTDYKFTVPADLPQGTSYNEAMVDALKTVAHKAGVSQEAAAAIHDGIVAFAKQSYEQHQTAAQERLVTSIKSAVGELETSWKSQVGTPGFTRNVELAKRAIRMSGDGMMDALKDAGAVQEVNGELMVTNAKLFAAFAKMGEGMYAEDTLFGDVGGDKNPFADGTEDMAMQGRLVQNDPDKAALLIRAAGKEKMFAQFLERHKAGATKRH